MPGTLIVTFVWLQHPTMKIRSTKVINQKFTKSAVKRHVSHAYPDRSYQEQHVQMLGMLPGL